MKICKILVLFLVCAPLCSFAFFPPKEQSSPGEVLKYRNRKKAEYREEREKYEQRMVNSRKQVMAEMQNIPWTSGGSRPGGRQIPLSDSYKQEILKNDKIVPVMVAFFIAINILCIFGIKKLNIFGRDQAE
jgi:hypothetical protein